MGIELDYIFYQTQLVIYNGKGTSSARREGRGSWRFLGGY